MVYFELGCLPACAIRKLRILKYGCKLISTKDSFVRKCYLLMLEKCEFDPTCDNWVKTQIYSLGLGDFWVSHESISDQISYFINMAKQRITDHFIQSLRATLDCSSQSHIYKHI